MSKKMFIPKSACKNAAAIHDDVICSDELVFEYTGYPKYNITRFTQVDSRVPQKRPLASLAHTTWGVVEDSEQK